jgi:type II secretory pathway component PulJ
MKSPNRQRRVGFTLVEVTIACSLTVFLAIMLSTTWALLMRPTSDLIAWGQLFQEMDIAVTTLARDLGGSQLDCDETGYLGEKSQGLLLAWSAPSTDSDHLLLCFDGGTPPDGVATWETPTDDTIIDYYVDDNTHSLIRKSSKAPSTPYTVANNVKSMSVTSTTTTLEILLTFQCKVMATGDTLERTCTLKANK